MNLKLLKNTINNLNNLFNLDVRCNIKDRTNLKETIKNKIENRYIFVCKGHEDSVFYSFKYMEPVEMYKPMYLKNILEALNCLDLGVIDEKIININTAYMKTAHIFAQLSKATKLKVGAVLVKGDSVLSFGYNGTPSGWSNICEDELTDGTLKTRPEVLHAEANCISKMAKSNESSDGSDLYITHAPCLPCSKQIYTAGIKSVYFCKHYKTDEGIDFLKKANIKVEQISLK